MGSGGGEGGRGLAGGMLSGGLPQPTHFGAPEALIKVRWSQTLTPPGCTRGTHQTPLVPNLNLTWVHQRHSSNPVGSKP